MTVWISSNGPTRHVETSFGVPHLATIAASCLHRPSPVGAPRLPARCFCSLHVGDPVAWRLHRGVWLEQHTAMAIATAKLSPISFERCGAWLRDELPLEDAPEV